MRLQKIYDAAIQTRIHRVGDRTVCIADGCSVRLLDSYASNAVDDNGWFGYGCRHAARQHSAGAVECVLLSVVRSAWVSRLSGRTS